jgi:phage tail sheath gpL-like
MAQNGISLAAARGNFLTWCISGFLPLAGLCRPLYVAQMLDGLTGDNIGEPGQYYVIYSANEARDMFGNGSVAALMAIQHFATCPELPLYIAPIADPEGGVKATHTITVTGPAATSGVLSLAFLDLPVSVAVITGATADSVATTLAAQINKLTDLPFTAVAAAGVVTTTAKNAGEVGNWFSPVLNPNFGDHVPDGLTIAFAEGVAGSGTIDVSPAVLAMACPWDCIALGTEDENAVQLFIQLVRQQWMCGVQGDFRGGHVFHSKTDTAGQIAAYGRERNNPEECVVPVRTGYKYPGYMLAAATASRVCCTACYDPARPVQYDNGILGNMYDSAQCTSLWTPEEKKAFYDAGILNWDVAFTRGVRQTALWIEEPLTTYKYNPKTGAPDGAWQRVESRYTVTKFVRELGFWYRANYSSVALVNNGTRIPQGRRAISPRILQASILAWLRTTQLGITAEGDDAQLEQMVRVERTNTPDNCDPNRVNVLIDLDLVNQLARIATSIDVSPEFACIAPTVVAA